MSRCLTGADAVSLSGGIDSSVIAGYAAPVHAGRYGRPLGALSVVYPDQPAVDERRYIELLAKELDLDLHLRPNETRRMDALDELSRLVDGPVPTVALEEMERYYRHARRLGYRSVLAGEVAEFVIDAREGIMPHLLATGRLGEAARRLRHLRAGGVRPLALLRSVGAVAVPRTVASARAKWIKRRTVPDFLDARRITANYVRQKPPPRHRWRERQLAAFRGPGVSIEADEIIHTTCGVQVRRPWIDVDLWEFFLALPADHKYPAGGLRKSLVRELSRGRVPDEVLDRTDKTVFDDAVMAGIDYSALRGWVRRGDFRMPGVNYERLEQRLTAEDLTLHDYIWAQDLAVAHAFIAAMRGDVPQRVRQTRGTSP